MLKWLTIINNIVWIVLGIMCIRVLLKVKVSTKKENKNKVAPPNIVFDSRENAQEVVDGFFELLDKYECVTVADLNDLTGLNSKYSDCNYGWCAKDIKHLTIYRAKGGYSINLPSPEYIN